MEVGEAAHPRPERAPGLMEEDQMVVEARRSDSREEGAAVAAADCPSHLADSAPSCHFDPTGRFGSAADFGRRPRSRC